MSDEQKPVPSPGTVHLVERCDICRFPRDAKGVLVHDTWCFRKNQETVMTGDVLAKLELVYAYGASDTEACLFAGIAEETLRKYKLKHPDYAEHVAALKQQPVLRARKRVVEDIEKDANLAFKFLERRRKDEFAQRTEVTGRDGADLPAPILSNVIKVEAKPDDEKKGVLDDLDQA